MIGESAEPGETYFPFGFAIAGRVWDELEAVPSPSEEPAAFVHSLRLFSDAFNRWRFARVPESPPVHAGQLMALGLLNEVLRFLIDTYCTRQFPGAMVRALEWAGAEMGASAVNKTCRSVVGEYPPECVRSRKIRKAAYLSSASRNQPNRCHVTREAALLRLAMENPALIPFRGVFDDAPLCRTTPYVRLVRNLETFFAAQPAPPIGGGSLFDVLRAPMRACPDSLEGQLEFIRTHWGDRLPAELLDRLTLTQGLMREERRMRGPGPGPAHVLEFDRGALVDLYYPEPDRFTTDRAWMANAVLIAKNTYVWLHHLSRRFGRAVNRLDEIPDEELDRLAQWGFTGLWLIGLWERSHASQRIKQMTGNPEAAPSAYSLYDYVIAADLGGDAAYENLRARAMSRGIRLASDMVPNHMGLFSRWVLEHPEWFIQRAQPPYPSYRFTGADLSEDSRVALVIEDGYWDRRDAAVVFKRVDKWTGSETYIYHGNDGTSMPWNDTAQLNFLLPEVREAVIQMILHVARKFPIIRFDAAMTLAKKHYQRLWFPQPGDAGAIPSRAESSMARAEFDACFPNEFWREVVDRVTAEAPDTLLLAEAFWLMEGYFVRTLGMHRVYNSAFMNMLKMEENSKYRQTIKNVLEFSPAILQRFVNFMNNPDERTAVEQFGKGDKYFGAAIMLVTMPGLPMFGHGQIEGFTEKYGMEYRRAYWDETADENMVYRHETEVFPLMRKRHLFSGADNFALYDFVTPEGWVDENVFAYSNRCGDERALILYHNAYAATRGCIHTSTAINVGDAHHKTLVRKTLAAALALDDAPNRCYVFEDRRTRLEYVRNARGLAESGFHFELHAYQYCAFLNFREYEEFDGSWGRLEASLGGGGVPNAEDARQELIHEALLRAFSALSSPAMIRLAIEASEPDSREDFVAAAVAFLVEAAAFAPVKGDAESVTGALYADIDALRQWSPGEAEVAAAETSVVREVRRLPETLGVATPCVRVEFAVSLLRAIGTVCLLSATPSPGHLPRRLLLRALARSFRALGVDEWMAHLESLLAEILLDHAALAEAAAPGTRAAALKALFDDPAAQQYLQFNRHQGIVWLRKESIESLLYMIVFDVALQSRKKDPEAAGLLEGLARNAQAVLDGAEAGGYQVVQTLRLFGSS